MKIKNWIHAIDLTIERHRAVIDCKYANYSISKTEMMAKDWHYTCPLCEFAKSIAYHSPCEICVWSNFTNKRCSFGVGENDYWNDKKSIKRLNKWKEKLILDTAKDD